MDAQSSIADGKRASQTRQESTFLEAEAQVRHGQAAQTKKEQASQDSKRHAEPRVETGRSFQDPLFNWPAAAEVRGQLPVSPESPVRAAQLACVLHWVTTIV